MRRLWPLIVVWLLTACETRYGTYLVVDGGDALRFDRVEFFFGTSVGGPLPGSAADATPDPLDRGRVTKRLFAETDLQQAGAPVSSLNYYLTDAPHNAELGELLIAVAYLDDRPVGIGELYDFKLVDDAYLIYDVPLVAFEGQGAEVWGRDQAGAAAGPACVRWRRPAAGGVTVLAIVRDGDRDCDGFDDAGVDCDPLRYCDGTGDSTCVGGTPCVLGGPASCQLGGCVNKDGVATDPRVCTATTCVAQVICDECDLAEPIDKVFECLFARISTHGDDYTIPVTGSTSLCNEPYVFRITLPNNLPCKAAQLEGVSEFQGLPPYAFNFDVAEDNAGCLITVRPATAGAMFGSSIFHLLISIDLASGTRSAFVVGIRAAPGGCGGDLTLPIDAVFGTCS